jgi:RimJ/RimL family protein N-acetyltransferase
MHPSVIAGTDPASSDSSIVFRAPEAGDFETLAAIRRNMPLQALLLTVPDATDDQAVQEWLARRLADKDGAFRIVADASSNDTLGFMQIGQVHRRNKTGYGGIALSERSRGRGLGQTTLRFLIALARQNLGLTKLLSEIRADNFAALRMNLAMGYRIVGTLSAHFCDAEGKTHDVLLCERQLTNDTR